VSLDPLGTLGKEFHLLALVLLFLLHHILDLLGLATLLLTVVPLFLKHLELVVAFIELLVAFLQLSMVVLELGIVRIESLSVHLVSRFKGGGQLGLFVTVENRFSFELLVQGVDLLLEALLALLVLLFMLFFNELASRLKIVLLGGLVGLFVILLILEVFEFLLSLFALVLRGLLEFKETVFLDSQLLFQRGG